MLIAIPRALNHYYLFPRLEAFFEALGHRVVTTPPTSRPVLEAGIASCISDVCLPLKAYVGHLLQAAGIADAVLVPRLVSVDPARYYCPKFLALPDVARAKAPSARIVSVEMNAKKGPEVTRESFAALARSLGSTRAQGLDAFEAGERAARATELEALRPGPVTGLPKIALIGHPYVVQDDYLSSGVKRWLIGQGTEVVTAENVDRASLLRADPRLFRDVYWEGSWTQTRAAVGFIEGEGVSGMIFLSAFGCGPDSFTCDIVGRRARNAGHFPFARILIDEHTAREGLITRLEAFLDMIERGRRNGPRGSPDP